MSGDGTRGSCMTTADDTNIAPTAGPGRLPTSTLLMGAGGVLLLISAILPWVTVFGIGISGVSAQWGVITLLAGLAVLVAAFGAGRIFDAAKTALLTTIAAGLGMLSWSPQPAGSLTRSSS